MNRRAFLATAGSLLPVVLTGCPASNDDEPDPKIDSIELENHRRERVHEFDVTVEMDDEVVFEESYALEPAGSGDSTVVVEDPVSGADAYVVRVTAGEHSAETETEPLVSGDDRCRYLRFYLGTSLHWEHVGWPCE